MSLQSWVRRFDTYNETPRLILLKLTFIIAAAISLSCDKKHGQATVSAASTPLVMNIDRTSGRVTLASVGWPQPESHIWMTETAGTAKVKLADGDEQEFEFSGFTMLAIGGEVASAQFRLQQEGFYEAYQRAVSIARKYRLEPIKALDDWYKVNGRAHHMRTSVGAGRNEVGYVVGVEVGSIAVPYDVAFVEVNYNFRGIERVIQSGATLPSLDDLAKPVNGPR